MGSCAESADMSWRFGLKSWEKTFLNKHIIICLIFAMRRCTTRYTKQYTGRNVQRYTTIFGYVWSVCQIVTKITPPVSLQQPSVTKPLETLVIDHLTMPTTVHPLTQQSVSYIMTMVDRATCYTVLCPVADATAKSTALAILHNWIPQYGVPMWVNTDLGRRIRLKYYSYICGITKLQIRGTSRSDSSNCTNSFT